MKRRTFTPSAAQKAASREKRNALVARSVPIQLARKSGRLPWAELPTVNACLELIYTRESGQTDFRTFQGWKADGFSVEKGAVGFSIWGKPLTARAEGSEPAPDSFTTPAENEAAHGFSFFPLCYLFHAGQVADKAGNRPPTYRAQSGEPEFNETLGVPYDEDDAREIDLPTILRIAADSRETLRPCDVDRVMTKAAELDVADRFRAWLMDAPSFTHGTREAIANWTPEDDANEDTPPAPPIECRPETNPDTLQPIGTAGHACAGCYSTAHDGLDADNLCRDCWQKESAAEEDWQRTALPASAPQFTGELF